MAAHAVSGDWKAAKKAALTARATAVSDTLDHLTDLEEMLDTNGLVGAYGGGSDAITQEIRSLASRLRSLRSDYDAEAGRL